MTHSIEVPMDAGRVCDAIARIGYSPSSAVMDITDNSVTAGARNVMIEVDWDTGQTFARKNNVTAYRIVDDGHGMTDDEIQEALRLGSDVVYPPNSLSKYGMGLKSAGLSLGTRIQVVSKKNGAWSSLSYIDRNQIRESKRWIISRRPLTADEIGRCDHLLGDSSTGTVVDISGCSEIRQASAKRTIEELQREIGVVYFQFLRDPEHPLAITIKATEKPDIFVQPFDILFTEEAEEGFDPDNYDCFTPRRIVNTEIRLTPEPTEDPMSLEVVVFPRQNMKSYPDFSKEQREKIAFYRIERRNKGFFIYRNRRLIRWGDDLDGLVGRDLIGFRARIQINTSHDDILHVDVSKQRLSIPEDVRDAIAREVRIAIRDAERAFQLCTAKFDQPEVEGTAFNETNQDLVEEDPDDTGTESESPTVKKRREKNIKDAREVLEVEEPPTVSPLPELELFQKIRYSETVKADLLWEANRHPTDGPFVRINRNHTFYETALQKMDKGSAERQVLEAFLWCCAVAEIYAVEKIDIETADITKVLAKFKRVLSYNLVSWATENQNLFD